ncbi:MAG: hypothetical protein QM286_09015 [Acidobacteriota bacterium]|nr:hypothetical protein [Acidobacteriota bacterium]
MRRDQLEHAIRTACQIIGHPEVIIVGSQAILGSFGEDELPVEATMSVEVDVLPIAESNASTAELADLIEGAAGEWSPFEEQHGFSIDGVDLDTAVLPAGWRDRLVRVQNANTAAPSGQPQFIGWCLDPDDLCVAKLCAHREKDLNFVRALHDAGLVDAIVMAERLGQVDARHQHAAAVALRWLGSLPVRAGTASPEAPADMPSTDDVDPPWERVSRRLDGAAN